MPIYDVQFTTDAACAERQVAARNVEEAFATALTVDPDTLHFEPFTCLLPINEITIHDRSGRPHVWRSEELLLRLAAEELHLAATNVLTLLSRELVSFAFGRDTFIALERLEAAVSAAEGRRA